ncbi:MAG: DUF5611 family protein [Thermoplasmata archaeon]
MQTYDIKRGHFRELEGDGLRRILRGFGEVDGVEGRMRVSYGAIRDMAVWTDGKFLYVEMDMSRDVDNQTAGETVRAYNAFLERATGFTSKQRRARLQKRAKEGKL